MSEVDIHNTATLLPQSNVAVYSKDKATLEAAESVSGDWRFARVAFQIEEGDVETAIETFAEYQSPDIVIIQTDVIDESFVARLEALAENCEEGTEAIVIGPDNDVYLYRKLIDMGVGDYLVRPVNLEILSETIAKTLINQHGVAGSRLIAFIGAKGGVGTSMLARQMGWVLSDMFHQKTVLLDLSGGWSAHPVGLGFEPAATYAEAVKAAERGDSDSLARMMHRAGDRYSVLSCGGDTMLEPIAAREKIEKLIEDLMVQNPVVLADLSGAAPDIQKTVLARANQIALVTAGNVSCLRLARSLAIEIKDLRGESADDIALFMNMQGYAPSFEVSKADAETAMELKVAATLGFDPKLFLGLESEGKSVLAEKTAKPLVDSVFAPFVKNVLGFDGRDAPAQDNSEDGKNILSGLLGKLGKK